MYYNALTTAHQFYSQKLEIQAQSATFAANLEFDCLKVLMFNR